MSATTLLTRSEQDLGVGTSKQGAASGGAQGGYMGLNAARPLTIAALLESPVHFVPQQHKQKQSEVPYTPINLKPKPAVATSVSSPSAVSPKPAVPTSAAPTPAAPPPSSPFASIHPGVNWPKPYKAGAGLNNLGNTCFLNSALQCLLHTPPLVRLADESRHDRDACKFKTKKGFCMTCALPALVTHSFKKNMTAYSPTIITQNLRKIASHFRIGRQEDAHEFLRFCIDNMQLSAVFGKEKLPQALKDSTFVHQIFGGRLRSRVKCSECQHPSDTFDSVLDLSLDLNRGISSIKDALSGFTKIDQLRGQNKYKCEKCKRLVNAEKSFTIDKAPLCLTIHLKRFTPSGRKIGETIAYPETLKLGPYMSDRSSDPTYKLYGVINHSGGGPHSGHYTANVKASNQKWYSMNDSSVSPCAPPINNRSAYVLFYIREKGESLKTAINSGVISNGDGVKGVNGHGKRPRERDDAGSPHVKTNGSPAGSIASSNGVANGGGGKGWAQNGNGSPSPKKQKKHLNGGGPRPPIVETAALSAQASNGHFANAYATPPLSPGATASSNVKGVFQSNANGAGTSKKQQTLAQKQKLQLSAVGVLKKEAKPKGPKMTQKLQPKTIREP